MAYENIRSLQMISDWKDKDKQDVNPVVEDPDITKRVAAEVEYPAYNWAPSAFQRGQYNSEYADLIKAASDRIANWNYDPKNDVSYRAYAQQYMRNGANAYEDTLARQATRTGGVASSYAAAAAQQQYNNYMADLASKVPELEQLAYQKAMNNLNMYTGLDETAYNRWQNDEQMRYNDWARLQSAAQSAYNQRYNAELNKYKAANTAEEPKDYSSLVNILKGFKDYNRAENYMETYGQRNGLSNDQIFDILMEAGYDPMNDSDNIDYAYAALHNSWGEGRQETPWEDLREGRINQETYDYIEQQRKESKKRR